MFAFFIHVFEVESERSVSFRECGCDAAVVIDLVIPGDPSRTK